MSETSVPIDQKADILDRDQNADPGEEKPCGVMRKQTTESQTPPKSHLPADLSSLLHDTLQSGMLEDIKKFLVSATRFFDNVKNEQADKGPEHNSLTKDDLEKITKSFADISKALDIISGKANKIDTIQSYINNIESTLKSLENMPQTIADNLTEKLNIISELPTAKNLDSRFEAMENTLSTILQQAETQLNKKITQSLTSIIGERLQALDINKIIDNKLSPKINSINDQISENGKLLEKHIKTFDQLNILLENYTTYFDRINTNIEAIEGKINKKLDYISEYFNTNILKNHNEIQRKVDDKINALISSNEAQLNYIKTDISQLKGTLSDNAEKTKGKIESVSASLSDLQPFLKDEMGAISYKVDKLIANGASISERDEQIERLQREIQEQKDANRRLNEANAGMKTELAALEVQVSENDALKEEIRKLEAENADYRKESSSAQAKLESLSQSTAGAAADLARYRQWQNNSESFDMARQKLNACAIFQGIAQKYGIDPDSEAGLINCMMRLGPRDILDEIYDAAQANKKQTKEPITRAEQEAYSAISQCYRQIWQIDFDVFALPGDQPIDGSFQKCPFEKKEACDMIYPRDKFAYTQEVYVPILRTPKKDVWKQALVKGGNS